MIGLFLDMTEQANDTPTPISETAGRLAEELGLYTETPGIPYELSKVLAPTLYALISDTFGLLCGISDGSISVGQPRIQANLVRVISELPTTAQDYDPKDLASALSRILSRASGAGLTAENQPLNQLGRSSLRSR